MIPEARYLIEVSLCITTFYCLYLIFFCRTTFFVANRIYLAAGLTLSFIIPMLQLPVVSDDLHIIPVQFLKSSPEIVAHVAASSEAVRENSPFNFFILLYTGYWIGVVGMMLRLLLSLIAIIRLKRNSREEQNYDITLLRVEATQPFTFFRWIFLPTSETNASVVEHEKVHVRQCHWADLLFIELVHVLLWFNPVVIFYKRAVKLQHEYLADHYTLKNGIALESYLHCMLQQIHEESGVSLVHRFFSQTIKNRIIMMTKNKTSRKMSLLYFLALPAISLLLISFSFEPASITSINPPSSYEKEQVVIVVDAGHGGSDSGSSSTRGLIEKEFTLSLASTLKKAGEERGIKIILTRTADQSLSLTERTSIANSVHADAFISLHANYDKNNATTSGIDCIVSEQNSKFDNSKQLAQQLVTHLQQLKGIRVNGIKTADFFVLKSNKVPSVVVELGFLSNTADYDFIKEAANQQAMSEKIIAAVAAYAK